MLEVGTKIRAPKDTTFPNEIGTITYSNEGRVEISWPQSGFVSGYSKADSDFFLKTGIWTLAPSPSKIWKELNE
jgi:hypothetical protein